MAWVTAEMQRVLDVPRVESWSDEAVARWTEEFRVDGGSWEVLPHQAQALEQASKGLGLFLPITVGGGKTLLSMMLPRAYGVDPDDTLVICPAKLRDEAELERQIYLEHFDVPKLTYVSYTEISRDHKLLERLAPKLIIADEAHCLKRSGSTRSGRLNRFIKYFNPRRDEVRFVPMSGTFTHSSLHEYAHLALAALGDNVFLPRNWIELDAWARCLDVAHQTPATKEDWAKIAALADAFTDEDEGSLRERARLGFGRRMATTPGVVILEHSSCDKPIYIEGREIDPGDEVREAFEGAKGYFLPNGDIIDNQLDRASKLDQISAGFYYFWDWPDGEPDLEWVYARRDYNRAVRNYVKVGRKGLDTRGLVERALEKEDERIRDYDLLQAWEVWKTERHKPEPPRGTVWISDEPLRAAKEIAEELDALLWYEYVEEADRLEALGMRVFRPGERPVGGGPVAVSAQSHHVGLNLQYEWSNNVLLHMLTNASRLEQLFGRTHRQGQEADEVNVVYVISTSEARRRFKKAVDKARYIESTTKIPQKLLLALDS